MNLIATAIHPVRYHASHMAEWSLVCRTWTDALPRHVELSAEIPRTFPGINREAPSLPGRTCGSEVTPAPRRKRKAMDTAHRNAVGERMKRSRPARRKEGKSG